MTSHVDLWASVCVCFVFFLPPSIHTMMDGEELGQRDTNKKKRNFILGSPVH